MKLATLRRGGATVAARLDDGIYTPIDAYPDLGALLAEENWREIATAAIGHGIPEAEAELAAVVPAPSKVLCVGLNFRSHIEEMGRELPKYPTVFAKFADTLTGPSDPVVHAGDDTQMDWEGELAVIVGRTAYRVDESEAADCIAGYTVADDISMRGWQYRSTEWLQGKIWARSTPVGPVMVTSDEFDLENATLHTTVNGETVQKHGLGDLLFEPAYLVSYLSTMLPLHPGDLILTGTPGGVGRARTPEVYLKPGDVVEVTIDGIGAVSTAIVAPGSATPRS